VTARRVTYCRICSPLCGLVVDIEGDRVTRVQGDRDHPLTQGYTCPKGRRLGDLHSDPERLRASQRRVAPGVFEPVEASRAIAEIGARLTAIVDAHGPDAVAFFAGTQHQTSALTPSFAGGWFRALGSHKRFGTMTIDQSAKWVATGRLGAWQAGRQRFEDSDVWLLAGTNPLVSLQGGEFTGFPIHNPSERLREARRRGLALIVVDPRRTELARQADLHLQLRPGSDAALFAGMLRVLLSEGLEDRAFCEAHVDGLERLRRAVEPATPAAVATATGLGAHQIVEAARVFGRAERGMAKGGTGPDMGPYANVAEHLLQCLNVVCGRFPRAGERVAGSSVLKAPRPVRAQVIPPARSWETGYRNRFEAGLLMGELPCAALPDEILSPGKDRIRALVVSGGNPANAFPDRERIVSAMSGLDLLVTIDPWLSETARLADFVIAPALAFERPEDTRGYEHFFDRPFAQYTDALLPRPPGVIEDWEFFFDLASEMGLTLRIGRSTWAPGGEKPSSDELLAMYGSRGRVDYDDARRNPHGRVFDGIEPERVLPADEAHAGRFELLAPDVAEELSVALAGDRVASQAERPFRLIVRRIRETMNSLGRRVPGLPRTPYNPCHVHPDDLEALGVEAGSLVTLTSAHGSIRAVAEADASLLRGVVSLTHGFGELPGEVEDPRRYGSNPTRLLSLTEDLQSINGMPWMTALPIAIRRVTPLGSSSIENDRPEGID
jgi:anaerobic selenocysteine-containing dehydrogenase